MGTGLGKSVKIFPSPVRSGASPQVERGLLGRQLSLCALECFASEVSADARRGIHPGWPFWHPKSSHFFHGWYYDILIKKDTYKPSSKGIRLLFALPTSLNIFSYIHMYSHVLAIQSWHFCMIVSCFWLFGMLDRFYMMFPMLQLQDMNIETKKVNSKVIFTSTR